MCIAVFYMITAIKISKERKTILQSGVEMAKIFSSRVSLPLLEVDMPAIGTLLGEFTSSPGIVYLSIIDHKNNIVAYTNVGLIMSVVKDGARTVDQVSFWEGDSSYYKKNINFSSDVTYAKTKIGEIYLTISAAKIDKFETFFALGTLSSFTILLFVIIVLYYKELISSILSKMRSAYISQARSNSTFEETICIACPLYETNQPFSQEVFNCIDIDRLRIIQSINNELKPGVSDKSKDTFLSEIAKRKNLGWLKRKVIVQCIGIIKKLAT